MQQRTAFIVPSAPVLKRNPPTGPEWLHEVKHDGWRAQLYGTFVFSRNGKDISGRFSPIRAALADLPVMDAELVGRNHEVQMSAANNNIKVRSCLLAIAILFANTAQGSADPLQPNDDNTTTPIKHVIVIIGENRSFDHIFGTYVPRPGQSVLNILSEGIINADGSPGSNFVRARQYRARVTSAYDPAPSNKEAYDVLPPAMTDGAPEAVSDGKRPPFKSLAVAADLDAGIPAADRRLLLTGATGLPEKSVDTRLANATGLPNGPFQLTPGIAYDAYAGKPRASLLPDVAADGL